jgi:hypothetical protein
MSIEAMKKALRRAFNLGQTYWQQADSEYSSHWKKADVTKASFEQLVEETCQAIEQAEKQEPVAWINWNAATGERTISFVQESELASEPLYTSPPPRQPWAGLTDEDKQIAFDDTQEGGGFWEFADAIEATLRKKNHG